MGVYQFDTSVLIAQKYPSILITLYQHVTTALEGVASGKMGGALIPNLEANALIANLYTDRLKIATPPLSDKGLRLVTLKDRHPSLIQDFNEGIEKLKKEGTFQQILNKYGMK